MTVYFARPMVIFEKSPARAVLSPLTASGPLTKISPMCERSKIPTASRTVLCSVISEKYFTGMFQPLKSVKLAPSASCASNNAVVFNVMCRLLVDFERFRWWARADQVAVATGLINTRNRGEVFVHPQCRNRERGLFYRVRTVPI